MFRKGMSKMKIFHLGSHFCQLLKIAIICSLIIFDGLIHVNSADRHEKLMGVRNAIGSCRFTP